MADLMILENKISAVEKYLQLLERYQKMDFSEIKNDIDKQGALERYLYLASQAAIDLAEAFIAFKNYRKPTTMSESFYILQEQGIIENNLTEKMIKMTGFRNVMAHDYDKVDYEIVEEILKEGLKDIKEFVKIIEEKI